MKLFIISVIIMTAAAFLEVAGDDAIRIGLLQTGYRSVIKGFFILGSYGLIVNILSGPTRIPEWMKTLIGMFPAGLEMNFSKLLGGYVAIFALVSVWWGCHYYKDPVTWSTKIGLSLIIVGGLILQKGQQIYSWIQAKN